MLYIFLFLFFVGLSYLLGSVCSAIVVSRIFSLPDPCTEGSKNPGATNVLRLSGKKYAMMVLFFDMLKGLIPVLLAKYLGMPPSIIGFSCLGAVMGHMYPVFFHFKGGKGVATTLGALLGLHFVLGFVATMTWLLMAGFLGYSSLASILTLILMPIYAILMTGQLNIFLPLCFITLFVLYQHRQNIVRLMDGTEPKIKLRRNDLPDVLESVIQERENRQNHEVSSQEDTVEEKEALPSSHQKTSDDANFRKQER